MMDTHYYQMFDESQIGNTNQQHITVRSIFFGVFDTYSCSLLLVCMQSWDSNRSLYHSLGCSWRMDYFRWAEMHLRTRPCLIRSSANDCAKNLNGRGKGARYDGTYPRTSAVGSCSGLTGSYSGFSSSYKVWGLCHISSHTCVNVEI
jgi:hypothetical protein